MKVSIVIPAYNEEKCLASTIKSALNQNYPDFEVVVVNNASTDKTAEIASQFLVKVVYEPNKGLLYARERGRREASGEIIANMDADCLPKSDWLSRGVDLFKSPEVAAVTGPYDYFDGSKFFRSFSLLSQKYVYWATNAFLNFIGHGAILIGGNNFIRAKVLKEVGGYDTSILFYGEDTNTAKRIAIKGKIIFSRDLSMPTSARRFKAEGSLKISLLYLYHFIKTVIFTNI